MYHSEHKMTLIFIHTLEYYSIVYHGVRQNNAHISSDIQLIYIKNIPDLMDFVAVDNSH